MVDNLESKGEICFSGDLEADVAQSDNAESVASGILGESCGVRVAVFELCRGSTCGSCTPVRV